MRLRSTTTRGFGAIRDKEDWPLPAESHPPEGGTIVDLTSITSVARAPAGRIAGYPPEESPEIGTLDPRILAACDDDPVFRAQLHSLMLNLESTVGAGADEAAIFVIMGVDVPVECALISANLALVCAQAGYRVLLVDANIDVPVHDSLFHISNRLGVSALLSSEELPWGFIQSTAVPNLAVLPAGTAVHNATALLDREQLIHRLLSSGTDFDLILIDCGALSPQLAARVAIGANGAVLTAKEGMSSVRQMQHLVSLLDMQQVYPSGVVLMA